MAQKEVRQDTRVSIRTPAPGSAASASRTTGPATGGCSG